MNPRVGRATPPGNVYQALKDYASDSLHALERVPEFVRSVVGEADQFPAKIAAHRQGSHRGKPLCSSVLATESSKGT